jgi:alpha-L-fucosidase
MLALGVKESVLTAKHGCGFCTWPTTALLPDGQPYFYNVKPEDDVLGPYVASMKKAGIGHGFYYSLSTADYSANYYLEHGINISAEQQQAIEIYQLKELWTKYGNLTEIWLDGGFTPAIQSALQKTFSTYQPRVIAMNGGHATPNAARWIGTEGDMGAAYSAGIWSTYWYGICICM